jgi:WD40 repeat protein
VGWPERAWLWCRRAPLAAALLTALAVAMVGGTAGIWVQGIRAVDEKNRAVAAEKRAEEESDRVKRLLYDFLIVAAERALNGGQRDVAEEYLDQCPAKLRNIEWRLLQRRCLGSLLTLRPDSGQLTAAAYSPDGQWFAASSLGGPLRIFRAADGGPVKKFGGPARAVAFTADSRQVIVAAASEGAPIEIWDVASGKLVKTIAHATDILDPLAFSPDGSRVAVDHLSEVTDESPGGKSVLLEDQIRKHSTWNYTITVVEAPGGKSRALKVKLPGQIRLMAFAPGGRRLVVVHEPAKDFLPKLPRPNPLLPTWPKPETKPGQPGPKPGAKPEAKPETPQPQLEPVPETEDDGLASLKKNLFNSLSRPGTGFELRVLDLDDGRLVGTAQGPADVEPCGLVVSPDGSQIVVSGYGTIVPVWSVSPDASEFAETERRTSLVLHVFDARTGKPLKAPGYPAHGDDTVRLGLAGVPTMRLAVSPDGKWLAATYGPSIRIYDARTGRRAIQFEGHRAAPDGLAFSADSDRLLSASGKDGTLKIWDLARSGRNPLILSAAATLRHLRNGKSAFSPDGKRIAVAAAKGEIRICDVSTGEDLARAASPKDQPGRMTRNVVMLNAVLPFELAATDLAYTADGKRLVAVYGDLIVGTWDLTGGKPACAEMFDVYAMDLVANEQGSRYFSRLKLSPGAEYVARWSSSGRSGNLGVWQLPGRRRVFSHHVVVGFDDEPRALFSADGKMLRLTGVSSEEKPSTRTWDVKTGKPVAETPAGFLESGCAPPDGSRYLAITEKGEVQVFEHDTNRQLLTLTGQQPYVWAAFSPDGQRIAAATAYTIEVYNGSPLPAVLAAAESEVERGVVPPVDSNHARPVK